MKKILMFSFSFLLLSSFLWLPSSTDNGIKFQEITFNQALQQAKKDHKYVFMNVYAVWCAPCTNLKKTTFKSDKIGSAFNKSFINISVDAEKGQCKLTLLIQEQLASSLRPILPLAFYL